MSNRFRSSIRFFTAAATIGLALVSAVIVTAVVTMEVPSPTEFRASLPPSEAWVIDRGGEPIQVIRVDHQIRRLAWASLDDASPVLVDSVVAAEDRRFHSHPGIDPVAILREIAAAASGRRPAGASTISMQLAGMMSESGNGRRSPVAKLGQMRDALALERTWSKTEILEAYLNAVPFRGELVGIEAAARLLFGKNPASIDAAEAAILAAMIRAPNAPPTSVAARACNLLRQLDRRGCERARRLASPSSQKPAMAGPVAIAPHVARRLSSELVPGARVVTTIDAGLQRRSLDAVADRIIGLEGRNVHDAAVLVTENATGAIRAYVGSSGESSMARHVDGVIARRQAGSTLKPFVYGLAIDQRRITAASLLDDSALEIQTAAGGVYRPRNYDRRFHGQVTVREALASSINTPAVRAIFLAGVPDTVETLRRAGFGHLAGPEHYGASLALGSADVTLRELVEAYRMLATGGVRRSLTLTDERPASEDGRVLSPETAFVLTSILSDRAARARTFGLASPLDTPGFAAVKTGTSKDMRDNWCIGFTETHTIGVWVGNFDGSPMWNVSGVSGACPIWHDIVDTLHADRPSMPPLPPPGVIRRTVIVHGRPHAEWFLSGTEPRVGEVALPSAPVTPAIVYPVDGMIVALDPDIPNDRQRVRFRARGTRSAYWQMDGRLLGPAGAGFEWLPVHGRHRLELVSDEGVEDVVTFRVR